MAISKGTIAAVLGDLNDATLGFNGCMHWACTVTGTGVLAGASRVDLRLGFVNSMTRLQHQWA